jgi:hypothetical protein
VYNKENEWINELVQVELVDALYDVALIVYVHVNLITLVPTLLSTIPCQLYFTLQGVHSTPTYSGHHVWGGDSENKEARSTGGKLSQSCTTHLADFTAPIPSSKLPDSYRLGFDDVEGFMPSHQFRIAYRCGSLVSLALLVAMSADQANNVEDQWNRHFTEEISCS